MGNKFALLKWKKSNDVAQIRVAHPGRGEEAQTVVYTGNADFYKDAGIDNGKKYDYSVTALDEASNSVEQKATAVPLPALYNPAAGASAASSCSSGCRSRRDVLQPADLARQAEGRLRVAARAAAGRAAAREARRQALRAATRQDVSLVRGPGRGRKIDRRWPPDRRAPSATPR